jgi:hypothetical protein
MIQAALLLLGGSAQATPVDDMVKQGFSCDPGLQGEVICRKDGAASKNCDTEGSCYVIMYDGLAVKRDKVIQADASGGL